MDLPELGGLSEQSWIVPNRNAIFLSVAVNVACQAGADTVTIGCNEDDADYFPDCRRDFISAINAAVKSAGYDVEICAPFLQMKKWQIIAKARRLQVDMRSTWTCYRGGDKPCGECGACKKHADSVRVESEMNEMRPL